MQKSAAELIVRHVVTALRPTWRQSKCPGLGHMKPAGLPLTSVPSLAAAYSACSSFFASTCPASQRLKESAAVVRKT